jgi:DNA invertase Pin-like site-specific DNA recombinase
VRSGIANAKAKGKLLGRPRVVVDIEQVSRFRAGGMSWPQIARKLGVSVGTVFQAGHSLSTNLPTATHPAH